MTKNLAISILCLAMSSVLGAGSLETDFLHPPMQFKSQPLWHLNGTLETGKIRRQLTAARDKSGFSGVAVLPVKETRPKYLTEDYFARYRDILETSQKLGMSVILYDDVGFPSGTAGGEMKKRFPDDIAARLDMTESDVVGPKDWKTALGEGIFMGAVAMEMKSLARRDISKHVTDGTLAWQVPAGQWKVMIFTCLRMGDCVDYLNPVSVDRFCSLTYDRYYQRFSKHFGSTITMNFFDDINIRRLSYRNWTPNFNEKFEAKNGFSPVAYYPALWYDIGPDTAAARVALHGFRAELLAEGYPRKVNEWCAAHGIHSTGHAMGQYHPQPSFLGGDHIKFYSHCDIPMIDSIHYYGHGRPGFKLTSSASCSYDRPLTAVEIYGNYRSFDKTMLYRSGMELFARGANLFLPHGMWYDPNRVRIPPLISHFSAEVGPELAAYNDWVGRASMLLQGGRHVADIGVLYPVVTMQAYARFGGPAGPHPGLTMPKNTDFNRLSDLLTGRIRRDFTFLHPKILDTKCRIRGNRLHLQNKINHEAYGVIIMPSVSTLHWRTLEKIRAFYEAGGKVIATTCLPAASAEFGRDREVKEAVADMFAAASTPGPGYTKRTSAAGGATYFIASLKDNEAALDAALQDAMPVADVRFGPGTPRFTHLPQSGSGPPKEGQHTGMFSYLHKVKAGRHIYFMANSTDAPVDTDVVLRGDLDLQCWNPHDGTMSDVNTRVIHEQGVRLTQTTLKLDALKTLFLVEKK